MTWKSGVIGMNKTQKSPIPNIIKFVEYDVPLGMTKIRIPFLHYPEMIGSDIPLDIKDVTVTTLAQILVQRDSEVKYLTERIEKQYDEIKPLIKAASKFQNLKFELIKYYSFMTKHDQELIEGILKKMEKQN